MKALWLAAVVSVLCAGCLMHVQTHAPVPGCHLAQAVIPTNCQRNPLIKDRIEMTCVTTVFVNGKPRTAVQNLTIKCVAK